MLGVRRGRLVRGSDGGAQAWVFQSRSDLAARPSVRIALWDFWSILGEAGEIDGVVGEV